MKARTLISAATSMVLGLGWIAPIEMAAAAPAASSPSTAHSATQPARSAPSPAAASQLDRGSATTAEKEPVGVDDATASRNAAQSRMHECGHQWSSMKKSGAAAGLTWKEFSQGCLARK